MCNLTWPSTIRTNLESKFPNLTLNYQVQVHSSWTECSNPRRMYWNTRSPKKQMTNAHIGEMGEMHGEEKNDVDIELRK